MLLFADAVDEQRVLMIPTPIHLVVDHVPSRLKLPVSIFRLFKRRSIGLIR